MKSRTIWILGISSALTAAAVVYVFLSAVATASLRFWYCGPASLDHPEAACRISMKLLLLSYGISAIAPVLAAAAIRLHWHRSKGSKISFKPKPLRDSA